MSLLTGERTQRDMLPKLTEGSCIHPIARTYNVRSRLFILVSLIVYFTAASKTR